MKTIPKAELDRMARDIEKAAAGETVIEWTEDWKPTGRWVTFDADRYAEWTRSLLPTALARVSPDSKVLVGNMFFRNLVLPLTANRYRMFSRLPDGKMRSWLSLGPRRGECSFSKPVSIPQIIGLHGEVWMSLTPMEVLTQRPGVRKARGRVLIGGLGMGWMARRACEKKTVESVTVVEIDPDVAKAFAFEHPKLTVKVGDVWDTDPTRYETVLLDVWMDYGAAAGAPKLKEWKKRHNRVWAWGDVGDWALEGSVY